MPNDNDLEESVLSDLHKDAYGHRPREGFWKSWRAMSRQEKEIEWNRIQRHTSIANARLIAAAPELLYALKSLRDDISRLGWGQPYPGRNHALMDRVDAAIAKAEGQS